MTRRRQRAGRPAGRQAAGMITLGALLGALVGGAALAPSARAVQPRPRPEKEKDMEESSKVVVSGADERQQLELTVYNNDLALVREVREVDLPKGGFELEFQDVPSRIEPRSLLIEAGGKSGLDILEQNYEYDLMSREKILEKYVGRKIAWIQDDGERIEGTLLGMAAGPVYEVDGKIVFEVPGRIALPSLPENLRARPTLVWQAQTEHGGEEEIGASYLTSGLSWSADYVLQLDPAGERGELRSWVSLDNRTGAAFRDARLQLVAGEINRAPQPQPAPGVRYMMDKATTAESFQEEALYDYHLYTLERPTTLKDSQIKQISLFAAPDVKVERHYRLQSTPAVFRGGPERQEPKVWVYYVFWNKQDSGLGRPLPAGTVRVYGQSSEGSRQLIGEDRIDHTPRDEKVELRTGAAFDVKAERVRTDYRRVSERVHESAFAITLRNHKDQDVLVEVTEQVGGDWRILESSLPYEKLSAQEIRFDVPVPADGETVLTYRVQVTY
jgi:hypothetical protein